MNININTDEKFQISEPGGNLVAPTIDQEIQLTLYQGFSLSEYEGDPPVYTATADEVIVFEKTPRLIDYGYGYSELYYLPEGTPQTWNDYIWCISIQNGTNPERKWLCRACNTDSGFYVQQYYIINETTNPITFELEQGYATGPSPSLEESFITKTIATTDQLIGKEILEFDTKDNPSAEQTAFPVVGEEGRIYIAKDTNDIYRWDGSQYVKISESDLSGYVQKTGDTMTGQLTVQNSVTIGTRIGSTGNRSLVMGNNCAAQGAHSMAQGYATSAYGQYSHAEGAGTIASGSSVHAEGRYNYSHSSSVTSANALHMVGFGTSTSDRKNAIETMQDGKTYVYGIGTYNGTNPDGTNDLATIVNAKADGSHVHSYIVDGDTTVSAIDGGTATISRAALEKEGCCRFYQTKRTSPSFTFPYSVNIYFQDSFADLKTNTANIIEFSISYNGNSYNCTGTKFSGTPVGYDIISDLSWMNGAKIYFDRNNNNTIIVTALGDGNPMSSDSDPYKVLGNNNGETLSTYTYTRAATTNTIATIDQIKPAYNATLTIKKNGSTVGTFTANASADTTVNIVETDPVFDSWRNSTEEVKIGCDTSIAGPSPVAIGNFAQARVYPESGSVIAPERGAVAIGHSATASSEGEPAVAIGALAGAMDAAAVAVGFNVTASGLASVAIGYGPTAYGENSIAIGLDADVSAPTAQSSCAKNGVAIGAGAVVKVSPTLSGDPSTVQLGVGENNNQGTLQFRSYPLVLADGNISADRLTNAKDVIKTAVQTSDPNIATKLTTLRNGNPTITEIADLLSTLYSAIGL